MISRRKHSHLLIAGLLRRNSEGTLVNVRVFVGIPGGEPKMKLLVSLVIGGIYSNVCSPRNGIVGFNCTRRAMQHVVSRGPIHQ